MRFSYTCPSTNLHFLSVESPLQLKYKSNVRQFTKTTFTRDNEQSCLVSASSWFGMWLSGSETDPENTLTPFPPAGNGVRSGSPNFSAFRGILMKNRLFQNLKICFTKHFWVFQCEPLKTSVSVSLIWTGSRAHNGEYTRKGQIRRTSALTEQKLAGNRCDPPACCSCWLSPLCIVQLPLLMTPP